MGVIANPTRPDDPAVSRSLHRATTRLLWSTIMVAPPRLRRRPSSDGPRWPTLTASASTGRQPHGSASLISLLALPVIALETAGVPVALDRATHLAASRWGDAALCRFRRMPPAVGALLPLGFALALGGLAAVVAGDGPVVGSRGLIAVGLGVGLSATGLAIHNASRSVLAVALFRYARDGRAHHPFEVGAMTRAAAPASNLTELLTASGVLAPVDDRQLTIGRHHRHRWHFHDR